MDTIRSKQICRRFVGTLLWQRLADKNGAKVFRRGWYEFPTGRVSIPPTGRASGLPPTSGINGTRIAMGQTDSLPAVPSTRSDPRNSPQAEDDRGADDAPHSKLATSIMVLEGLADRVPRRRASSATVYPLGRLSETQYEVEIAGTRGEHAVTNRSGCLMERADATMARLGTMRVKTGTLRSAEHSSNYVWSGRTVASRN